MSDRFFELDDAAEDAERTRIKFCGMTREVDIEQALALGVDALGFVFYAPSPRHLSIARAAELVARVPASIATVGLFVNAPADEIAAVLERVPLSLLQFHGEETPDACKAFARPYMKAARVTPELDLLEFADAYRDAATLLLDAHTAGYGGSGKVFDWSLVPHQLIGPAAARRVVLSGGLSTANVADAIARVRPWAVDVSSGIESAKGIKDADAMRQFVAAVRLADNSADKSLR
ncbi:MAG: phosphoribosylanthranilate isomerase [Burkholderiaceae bacterium]